MLDLIFFKKRKKNKQKKEKGRGLRLPLLSRGGAWLASLCLSWSFLALPLPAPSSCGGGAVRVIVLGGRCTWGGLRLGRFVPLAARGSGVSVRRALPSPLLRLCPSVPSGWARAAGRSFLARRSGGAFRSSGLPLPPAAMPSGLASCVALGGVRRVPRALPLPPLLRLPAPSPAVLGLFLAALGAVVLYGCGGGLVGDWLGV